MVHFEVRSFEVRSNSRLGPFRGSVIRGSLTFEPWSFEVRSNSRFSHLKFGHSRFALSTFSLSRFGLSRFGHSRFGHGFPAGLGAERAAWPLRPPPHPCYYFHRQCGSGARDPVQVSPFHYRVMLLPLELWRAGSPVRVPLLTGKQSVQGRLNAIPPGPLFTSWISCQSGIFA